MLSALLLLAAVILFILEYFVRWSLVPAGLACFAGAFLVKAAELSFQLGN